MSRLRPIFGLLVFCSLGLLPLPAGELQTFTNDAGQTIEAELIELSSDGGTVTLRLANGRKIEALLAAFSRDDQKKIEAWWQEVQASKQVLSEGARLNVTAKMNRKSTRNDRDSGYYSSVDDKTVAFYPEVVIENEEWNTFTGNEVRLVIVAEDLRYPSRRLVVSASTLKTDLAEHSKTLLEGEPFRLRFYEYDSHYSNYEYKYGYKYEGYIVVIKNSAGEVTHTRASKTKYLSNLEEIYRCKAGDVYEEDLEHKLNIGPNSYFVY